MTRVIALAACTMLSALPLAAQAARPPATDSSGNAALACSTTAPAPRGSSPDLAAAPRIARTATIDTTITLAIASRTWRRESYDGGVALGTGVLARDRSRWSACAGAAVHLGQVETTLRNVRGTIHLRADLTALDHAGSTAASMDSSLQRPGSTPPAVPPRR